MIILDLVYLFGRQGLFLFPDLESAYFLLPHFQISFVLNGEKWEEKRIISLFFLLHFLFWERSGTGTENERKPLFLLFFLSFCFFSSVFSHFSLFFSLFFLFWEGGWVRKWEGIFRYLFPLFFFFGEKQLEKMKEVLPIFRSFFLDFLFLKTLLFFSFSFFFGKGEKDKGNCLFRDNPFLQEHNCLSTPRTFILGQNCLAFAKHKTA